MLAKDWGDLCRQYHHLFSPDFPERTEQINIIIQAQVLNYQTQYTNNIIKLKVLKIGNIYNPAKIWSVTAAISFECDYKWQ